MLLELEAVKAGGRALQGAYSIGDGTNKKKDKRIKELENQLAQAQAQGGSAGGRTKWHPKGEAKSAGRGEPAWPKPCWDEAKVKGTCKFGDSCRFSHDPQVLKEFNKGRGKGSEAQSQENEIQK